MGSLQEMISLPFTDLKLQDLLAEQMYGVWVPMALLEYSSSLEVIRAEEQAGFVNCDSHPQLVCKAVLISHSLKDPCFRSWRRRMLNPA